MLTASEAQAKTEEREANIVRFAVSTPEFYKAQCPTLCILHTTFHKHHVLYNNDISANATPHPEGSMSVFMILVTCEDAYPMGAMKLAE